MRKFKLNHSRKRSHATTDVFCYITDELHQEKQTEISLGFKFNVVINKNCINYSNLRIQKIHSANSEIFPFQILDKVTQNWNMSEEFNLAWQNKMWSLGLTFLGNVKQSTYVRLSIQ
jgi:hypothetical protein